MNRDDLLAAQTHDNVGAFLRVLREGESSQDDSAYRWLYGSTAKNPKLFDSFDEHPTVRTYERYDGEFLANGKIDYTTAAGAYQETLTSWGEFCKAFGRMPFTPENQDLCAVWLINRAGALDDVIAGRLDVAIQRLRKVWTSLAIPKRQKEAPQVFAAYGGVEANGAVSAPTTEVKPMLPLIPILIESLVPMIPQLAKLFGSGSEVSNRNNAALEVVADKIVQATNAVNLQDAVAKAQGDPAMLDVVKQAVSDAMFTIGEAGSGGIDGARKAAAVSDGDWRKVAFSGPFVLALMVLPLIYAVVFAALLKFEWLAEITSEVRTGVITSVTGLILGSLMGYFYGTSATSAKKDAALAGK